MSSARVEIDSDRIATIWLDAPGKRVNTLNRQMWADLAAAIDQIEQASPAGVVIMSAKPGTFVVGADLYEIRDMSDAQFDGYIGDGQQLLERIEKLPMPTIAAINGDCVGGGLELALACNLRVAMGGDAAIGLPETRLGLIPAWGGTVRLPQLIGRNAVELIADATLLNPTAASSAMVVDDVLSPQEFSSIYRRLAVYLVVNPLPKHRRLFDQPGFFEPVLASTDARSPAIRKLIEVIRTGLREGKQAGLDAERNGIVELRRSPEGQKLLGDFFARQAQKKSGG